MHSSQKRKSVRWSVSTQRIMDVSKVGIAEIFKNSSFLLDSWQATFFDSILRRSLRENGKVNFQRMWSSDVSRSDSARVPLNISTKTFGTQWELVYGSEDVSDMDFQFQQGLDGRMRASIEITMRELFRTERFQQDFMYRVVEDLAKHISHQVDAIMFSGELDKLIRDAIREEVKKQVAATVEERLEEVFGED